MEEIPGYPDSCHTYNTMLTDQRNLTPQDGQPPLHVSPCARSHNDYSTPV